MSQSAARMNRLQIREQEQLNRERRHQQAAEEQQGALAMRRTKEQYSHVKGHRYGRATSGGGPAASAGDDAEIRVYVRECDGDMAQSYRYRESESDAVMCAMSSPAAAAASQQQQRRSRVGSGPEAVAAQPPSRLMVAAGTTRTNSGSGAPAATPGRGQVPRYLQQRKAELAAEKRAIEDEAQRRQEQAKVPPGHRFVPDEEKADALAKLEERRKELQAELGRIPLRFDTQSIRTRRGNIEAEMREIDAAVLKYSSKKPLYVPLY